MSQVLVTLSMWLHTLGTVVLIGHHLLLSLIYLPVLARSNTTVLSEISKRSRPWMYISLFILFSSSFSLAPILHLPTRIIWELQISETFGES